MPAKRVHWVEDDDFVFIPPSTPNTPALSLDNVSLIDSSPPTTPQFPSSSRDFWPSPPKFRTAGSTLPLLERDLGGSGSNIHISPASPTTFRFSPPSATNQRNLLSAHPLLTHHPRDPPLIWNVTRQPSSSSVRFAAGTESDQASLMSAATVPPVAHITIQCIPAPFSCWQPLQLDAVDSPLHSFITIYDVLSGIHRYLQRRVSAAEFAEFTVPGSQAALSRAFYRRCPSLPSTVGGDGYTDEQRDGLKRVDCLLGRTVFLGLARAEDGSDSWQLHVC